MPYAEVGICTNPTFHPRNPCLGLCLLSHILAFPCPPAAGQSCCGPVSKIPGLVPGPVAGSSIPTDKDGGCPAQFLVLPGQRQHARDSRGQVRASGPTQHYPLPSRLLLCRRFSGAPPISRATHGCSHWAAFYPKVGDN